MLAASSQWRWAKTAPPWCGPWQGRHPTEGGNLGESSDEQNSFTAKAEIARVLLQHRVKITQPGAGNSGGP
jgi:hypothetical protein